MLPVHHNVKTRILPNGQGRSNVTAELGFPGCLPSPSVTGNLCLSSSSGFYKSMGFFPFFFIHWMNLASTLAHPAECNLLFPYWEGDLDGPHLASSRWTGVGMLTQPCHGSSLPSGLRKHHIKEMAGKTGSENSTKSKATDWFYNTSSHL